MRIATVFCDASRDYRNTTIQTYKTETETKRRQKKQVTKKLNDTQHNKEL